MSALQLASSLEMTQRAGEMCSPSLEACFIQPQDWDALAIQFRDIIHEQTECFNALRWEPHQLERIAFYRQGKLVSAAVVLKMKFPLVGGGIAVVKWGPLWRHKDQDDNPKILLQTVERLQDIYAHQRGYFLTFFPRADPEISAQEEEIFSLCGFQKGEALASPERYFVNTHISHEQARASLSQKWRYNLKKAEKNNLTCRFAAGEEGFTTFMQLYHSMLERKAFHDTSAIDTLKDLMEAKEPHLRPKILIVEQDGEAIAGGVVDASGERAVYLYGATNEKALPLKAGYVMHWAILSYLIDHPTCRWYDLGGADKDCDLHQFKRGFVGKMGHVTITPSYYHYGATIKARLLGHALYFARRKKGEIARLLHDARHRGIHSLFKSGK